MLQPKPWLDFPSSTTPRTAAAYRAMEQRAANWAGADSATGPGVAGVGDFRVKQRAAGANLSADVGLGGVANTVFVPTDGAGGAQRYEHAGAQLNVPFLSSDPTNPRVDRVVAEAPADPDSTSPRVFVLTGTPTAGTTLDLLNGAPTVGATRVLLADVHRPAGSVSVVSADIRNRRPVSVPVPPQGVGTLGVTRDEVAFTPHGSLVTSIGVGVDAGAGVDNHQAWALMILPRRIVNATRIRWKFRQGATPASSAYVLGVYDASMRLIVQSASAFSGVANATVEHQLTIAATTFDAGLYYVAIGVAAVTAASSPRWQGVPLTTNANSVGPSIRGLAYRNTVGGAVLPTFNAPGAPSDVAALTSDTVMVPVPIVSLSVG